MDILLSHVSVVTMDERMSIYTDAFVGVEDGKISWLSKKAPEEQPRQIIDGTGMVVIPGLVNCHTNLEQTILRGYGDDCDLATWLRDRVYGPMEKMDDRAAKASALLGIAECLRHGVTSVSDLTTHADAVAQAVSESGIKANIAPELICLSEEDFDFEKDPACQTLVKTVENWHGHDNGRILVEAGLQGEGTSVYPLWDAVAEYTVNSGLGLHLNLNQFPGDGEDCLERTGLTETQVLDCHGLFGARTQAAHCCGLEAEDLQLLGKRKVSAICCPTRNRKLAAGEADVLSMVRAGMNVALGTDSAAAADSLDLLLQVREVALQAKAQSGKAETLPAAAALLLATGCGAGAQGRTKECGMIKVGYDADLAVLDFTQPHLVPCHDLTASVVYNATGRDVCMTMVRGQILYAAGRYPTIDLSQVMKELTDHAMPTVYAPGQTEERS